MSTPKLRIKSGDIVIVIAGKNKGKSGKVLSVDPFRRRVVVEGVAMAKRHTKPVGERPGGVVFKEMSIDISNVALWDEKGERRVKVAFGVSPEGRKIRVDRKTRLPVE